MRRRGSIIWQSRAPADPPADLPALPAFPVAPTVAAGTVYDLNDVQFTELQPGANSRLIGGHGAQLSFLRMDPGMSFALHLHPEEQLMCVLRGAMDEIILDGTAAMKQGDLLYLPATMVHGGKVGDRGCDVLDVFYPPRPDYMAKKVAREAAYGAIIPADAKVELFVDGAKTKPGLIFCEGPKWLAGKLYLSSMAFDQKWGFHKKRSATLEVDPDGTYRAISNGMPHQRADAAGQREPGRVRHGRAPRDRDDDEGADRADAGRGVRGQAHRRPQRPRHRRQGRDLFHRPAVHGRKPRSSSRGGPSITSHREGKLTRIIPPNDFAMPNGVLLSPDGKTLYVNNTYDNESFWNVDSDKDNWVWAYRG